MGLVFNTPMMAILQEVHTTFKNMSKRQFEKSINASLWQIKVQRGNICFLMPLVIMPCIFYDIFTLLQKSSLAIQVTAMSYSKKRKKH